jgi:transcription-repair coupling factor (superfamily II helicase)
MTSPSETLGSDAEKRLAAISQLDELGAGFMLASHDLEIRGAGELLGEEQSGTIDEIGFSLYSEYLRRAIRDLAGPSLATRIPIDQTSSNRAEVQLNLPALFPDSYLPDVHVRLVLYKRITGARCADELHELQLEAIDRFGLLPEAAKSLFRIRNLQLASESLGLRRFTLDRNGGKMEFDRAPTVDPDVVLEMMNSQPNVFRMMDGHVIQIRASLQDHQVRLRFAEDTLAQLSTK